jgi:hypothetical protein
MIRKSSAFVMAVVAVAGCSNLSTDLPPLQPISIVTVRSVPNDASPSGFSGKAFAYFFSERGFSYSDSRFASNTCIGPVLLNGGGSGPSQWIEPGSPVNFTIKGASGVAPRTVQMVTGAPGETDAHVYTNVSTPALYPGTDTTQITVPGAAGGFPALSVTGGTVDNFTFDTVADSSTGTGGLPIRWSAPTHPNSAMEVALVYKSSGSATDLDTQVVCTMVDDGEFTVPRQYLDGWQLAGDNSAPLAHEVRFTRYLTSVATAGDASILLINTLDKKLIK